VGCYACILWYLVFNILVQRSGLIAKGLMVRKTFFMDFMTLDDNKLLCSYQNIYRIEYYVTNEGGLK
jgi:hypothetical protein